MVKVNANDSIDFHITPKSYIFCTMHHISEENVSAQNLNFTIPIQSNKSLQISNCTEQETDGREMKITVVTFVYFGVRLLESFLAISSNVITAVVILKNKRLRTNTNFILLSLALGDFLSGLDTPFYIVSELYRSTTIGKNVCLLAGFIDLVGGFGNTFSVACIALDRYLAVVYPVYYYRLARKNDIGRMIVLVWIYILGFITLLFLFGQEQEKYPICFFKGNLSVWAHDLGIYGHVVILSLITYILYFKVWILLVRRFDRSNVTRPSIRSPIKRKKIIKLLGVMMIIYFVLALPITIVSFTDVLNKDMNWIQHLIFRSCWAIWYMSSFVNPFLYVWTKGCFRAAIRGLFRSESYSGVTRGSLCRMDDYEGHDMNR